MSESKFVKNVFSGYAYENIINQLGMDLKSYENADDKEKIEDELYFRYI